MLRRRLELLAHSSQCGCCGSTPLRLVAAGPAQQYSLQCRLVLPHLVAGVEGATAAAGAQGGKVGLRRQLCQLRSSLGAPVTAAAAAVGISG